MGISVPVVLYLKRREISNMDEELRINVYDEEDNVVKQVGANTVDFKMGDIMKLFKLLDVENIDNSFDLLNAINKAWKQFTKILSKMFPGMAEDDWDGVRIGELIPTVVKIIEQSFYEMMKVPKPKNA